MSLFKKDLEKEVILGAFLSQQYSKLNLGTTRIFDKEMQYKGVDIILEKDGLTFKIDEKAQLHYINKDLPTFALEINYLKNDNLKSGWLFDTKKVTEIYAFIFSIQLIDGIQHLQNENDIKSCEVVFVNRLRLIKELAKHHLNYESCNNHSIELRSNNEIKKIPHHSGFNFQISDQLAEKPVNLIVKKDFLVAIGKKINLYK